MKNTVTDEIIVCKTVDKGEIIYTKQALASLVGIAVAEIPGVVGLASRNIAEGLLGVLTKEVYSKGIFIKSDVSNEDTISVEVSIIVANDCKFSEVGKNAVNKVAYQIEQSTELKVSKVSIKIQGVKILD